MTTQLDRGTTTAPEPAALELKGLCGDVVALPGEPAYDEHRRPWNVALNQRPAAVAVPRNPEDVALVVRGAAAVGLRVAPQGTGHGAQPLVGRSLHDVVLLRTTALTDVWVDPARRLVRAGAGAIWQQVVDAVAPHGLVALHGSSPDVGVAGLALGGGVGWYARKLGLTANAVTAVELVTAEGRLVRADAGQHTDLFWAVRGSAANVGVVTSLELRLFEVPDVYAGQMAWELDDFERVLRTWNTWAADAPEEISTSLRAMRFPDLPHVPAHLRGRRLTILDGAMLGDDATAERILAPFRALGPQLDTWARVPAPSITRMHGDPEGPTPAVGRGGLVDRLDEAAIRSFVAAVGSEADTTVLMAELRQLGGALARTPEGAGAVGCLRGDYAAYFVTMAGAPGAFDRGRAETARLLESLAGVAAKGAYLNLAERAVDPSPAYGEGWSRLVQLRRSLDPHGLFVAQQPVPLEE